MKMKTKRTNPYTSLLGQIKGFVAKLKYRHTVALFYWKAESLIPTQAWRLDDVYQRTLAAQSLGYEVVIEADEKGMTMKCKKKISPPYCWEH